MVIYLGIDFHKNTRLTAKTLGYYMIVIFKTPIRYQLIKYAIDNLIS